MGSDGFVDLGELIEKFFMTNGGKIPTLLDIQTVVDNNEKKRFELVEEKGRFKIRAVQGHTMTAVKNEDLLTQLSVSHKDQTNIF